MKLMDEEKEMDPRDIIYWPAPEQQPNNKQLVEAYKERMLLWEWILII